MCSCGQIHYKAASHVQVLSFMIALAHHANRPRERVMYIEELLAMIAFNNGVANASIHA